MIPNKQLQYADSYHDSPSSASLNSFLSSQSAKRPMPFKHFFQLISTESMPEETVRTNSKTANGYSKNPATSPGGQPLHKTAGNTYKFFTLAGDELPLVYPPSSATINLRRKKTSVSTLSFGTGSGTLNTAPRSHQQLLQKRASTSHNFFAFGSLPQETTASNGLVQDLPSSPLLVNHSAATNENIGSSSASMIGANNNSSKNLTGASAVFSGINGNVDRDPGVYDNIILDSFARHPNELSLHEKYRYDLSRAQLKASSRTSALLAGFAMVALVELQYDKTTPRPLLITLAVVTTLLVSVHLLALMMSTCLLPYIEANGCTQDSPHIRLKFYIKLSWLFSTCIGLLLFLLEIGVIFFVKFNSVNYDFAAYITTIMLVPVVIVFVVISYLIHRSRFTHSIERVNDRVVDLQKFLSETEAVGTAVANVPNYILSCRSSSIPARNVANGPKNI